MPLEYIRVEMLPAADATKLRELLRKYLERVLFERLLKKAAHA
jgi:hypothetical protein